ncbi:MAG: aspartate 1-decarboxylase [Candidatus Margulisbacteria bacterium]|nr:aspartate 1-decarboxylase [Candidatus Margulisiibacteriota bacterium]
MWIVSLKSKIAYAKITHKDLYYVGSITIDQTIMERANIQMNEQVQIVNINNGARLVTYVIPGQRDTGIIGLNGPAARTCEIGDDIFILSYAHIDPQKESLNPIVVNMKQDHS